MSRLPRCTLRLKLSEAGLLRAVLNRNMEDAERRIRVMRAHAEMEQVSDETAALLTELQALHARLTAAIDKVCGL